MIDIIVKSADDQRALKIILERNGYNVELDRDPADGFDINYHVKFTPSNTDDSDDDNFKCDSYHTEQRFMSLDFGVLGTGSRTKIVGVCWGTKEREECYCHGDKRKCSFYKLNEDGRLI